MTTPKKIASERRRRAPLAGTEGAARVSIAAGASEVSGAAMTGTLSGREVHGGAHVDPASRAAERGAGRIRARPGDGTRSRGGSRRLGGRGGPHAGRRART